MLPEQYNEGEYIESLADWLQELKNKTYKIKHICVKCGKKLTSSISPIGSLSGYCPRCASKIWK